MFHVFFLRRRRFISTKQIYKKIIYTIPNTLYTKENEIKAKKRLEILKEGRKRNAGSHYVIQTIERHNPCNQCNTTHTYYIQDWRYHGFSCQSYVVYDLVIISWLSHMYVYKYSVQLITIHVCAQLITLCLCLLLSCPFI